MCIINIQKFLLFNLYFLRIAFWGGIGLFAFFSNKLIFFFEFFVIQHNISFSKLK